MNNNNNNLQDFIGGDMAPILDNELVVDAAQVGSLLGESLALDDDLAKRLVHNLINRKDKVINLKHTIGFVHSHSADVERFEKSLARCVVPIVDVVTPAQGAVAVNFQSTNQHKVPFVGEKIRDHRNGTDIYIVTGHKLILSSLSPTQQINLCVNTPWGVMTQCVYFNNGRLWKIRNIRELLQIILKCKLTLFNNNIIKRYKQQNRAMFAHERGFRNNQQRRGIIAFLRRVVMNLEFNHLADDLMDIREVRNQIGKAGWTKKANVNDAIPVVHSIAARRSADGVAVVDYAHQSYEGHLDQINDDDGIITRNAFAYRSNVTMHADGTAAQAGDVEKYKLVKDPIRSYGDTTARDCLFPDNTRDDYNDNNPVPIPQGIIGLNLAIVDEEESASSSSSSSSSSSEDGDDDANANDDEFEDGPGGGITVEVVKAMFSTFRVKIEENHQYTL